MKTGPAETPLPGPGVVSQLVHVWVVLSHDSDGVTLLANDQPSLLLRGVPQVDAIELKWEEKVSKSPFIP